MSEKRYIRKCDQCGKDYVAKSLKSRFDTPSCKSAYNRQKRNSLLLFQTNVVKTASKILISYEKFSIPLLHKLVKDAYEEGVREIEIRVEGLADLLLFRSHLKNEKSFGVFEFSLRKIDGRPNVYSIVKKYFFGSAGEQPNPEDIIRK